MQVEEREEEQNSNEMIEDSEFGPLAISKLEVKKISGGGRVCIYTKFLYFHALISKLGTWY